MTTLRIWDLPTRVFHWGLVLCVIGLIATANIGGDAMVWHMRLGYTVLTLLLFRLIWGFVGGYWSRFGSFPLGLDSVTAYVRQTDQASFGPGHNPLGSWSVVAMLFVLFAQVGSGFVIDDEIAYFGPFAGLVSSDWVQAGTRYHKDIGKFLLLGLVVVHVLAVLFHVWKKREPLVSAMWHGNKTLAQEHPESFDGSKPRLLAIALLLVCAGAVAWLVWYGYQSSAAAWG